MIFEWADGHTKEIQYGQIIKGLQYKFKRPDKCIVTEREIVESGYTSKMCDQYARLIMNSLRGHANVEYNPRINTWIFGEHTKREV